MHKMILPIQWMITLFFLLTIIIYPLFFVSLQNVCVYGKTGPSFLTYGDINITVSTSEPIDFMCLYEKRPLVHNLMFSGDTLHDIILMSTFPIANGILIISLILLIINFITQKLFLLS